MITRIEAFTSQPDAPTLPLGGLLPFYDPIFIRNVDGLGPVKADIITTPFASGRGELYQGSSTPKRNIVLTLGFNPDWEGSQTMASLRQILYRYFMPQNWCKLRFFSQELPDVDIEGYVESVEPNMFSQDPEIQVSIVNPKPDFIEVDSTSFNSVVDDGTLEFTFDYAGTIDTGYELRIDHSIDVVTYTGTITIKHTAFGEEQMFKIDPVTIDGTKHFKLTTVRNNKRVQAIYTDQTFDNLLARVTADSVWPVLRPGENVLRIIASSTGMLWSLAYFNRYGGL